MGFAMPPGGGRPKRRRRKPIQWEHMEQVRLVRELEGMGITLFAVPNGARIPYPKVKADLKAEGMRAGAPDLILVPMGKPVDDEKGVWLAPVAIELKKPKNRGSSKVSDAQKEMHAAMRQNGWIVLVCYGYQDAMEQLREVGVI